jgi:hypothetical protein
MGIVKQNFPGHVNVIVLGSITTPNWSESSDFDLDIIYPNGTDMEPMKEIVTSLANQKIKIPESPHVIGFYVTQERDVKDDISKSVGAYNLVLNRWIKQPSPVYVDPERDSKRFKRSIEDIDIEIGELSRDVKDIRLIVNAFQHAPDGEKLKMLQHLEDKKKEVEEDLKVLTEEYDDLHKARLQAFEDQPGDEKNLLNKHLMNQTLPGNVVFKMAERYGYRDLLEKLKSIYESMPR